LGSRRDTAGQGELMTENTSADSPAAATSAPAARPSQPVVVVPESRLPLGARPARNAVIAAGLIGYAWVLGGTAPFSLKALVGVLLPGAALGVIAYARPPERIPPPESVDVAGFSYWIIAIALLFEWEAAAVRDGSTSLHPSLTDLINPLLGPHPVKSAAIVIWLLAGWSLVRR
jgi:hypothetical protein